MVEFYTKLYMGPHARSMSSSHEEKTEYILPRFKRDLLMDIMKRFKNVWKPNSSDNTILDMIDCIAT